MAESPKEHRKRTRSVRGVSATCSHKDICNRGDFSQTNQSRQTPESKEAANVSQVRGTSSFQGAPAACHSSATDGLPGRDSERHHSDIYPVASADIAAFAARWTPLLKTEAALVAWDSKCVVRDTNLQTCTSLKTQQDVSCNEPDKGGTSSTGFDARSGTVAFGDSPRKSISYRSDGDKDLDEVDRREPSICGLFELWQFCCKYRHKRSFASPDARLPASGEFRGVHDTVKEDPRNALRGVGLRLTGPYDLFAGDLPLGKRALLTHARGFYDMPECQPVLAACSPLPTSYRPVSPAAASNAHRSTIACPTSLLSLEMGAVSATGSAADTHSLHPPDRSTTPAGTELCVAASSSDGARGKRKHHNTAAGSSGVVRGCHPPSAAVESAAIQTTEGSSAKQPTSHWMLGAWKVPADYHLCLFRDKGKESPHAVVANAPSEGHTFSVIAAACSGEILAAPTGKAAVTQNATTPFEPGGDRMSSTRTSRKYKGDESDVPLHTWAEGEKHQEDHHNGIEETVLRDAAAKSHNEPAKKEGSKVRSNSVMRPDHLKETLALKQTQPGQTAKTSEHTEKDVPLLLAAVLLHCEAIISSCQVSPAQGKAGKSTAQKYSKQRRQLTSKEEKPQRGKRSKLVAGSAETSTDMSSKAEDGHNRCPVVEEALRVEEELLAWIGVSTISEALRKIDESTRRWHRWRTKVSVCPDFSGMGVVAPYDKESEKGYRVLCTEEQLKKIVKTIKSATPAERNTQPLEELVALMPQEKRLAVSFVLQKYVKIQESKTTMLPTEPAATCEDEAAIMEKKDFEAVWKCA